MTQIISDPVQLATRFINLTNRNIFLTGKAGTGKTTFLKSIIKDTHKKAVIVAPTGIAAINAGGVTIHSMFQLPFGSFIPQNNLGFSSTLLKINEPQHLIKNLLMSNAKRNLIREMELLIIDEVSMLRADLLDAIDVILRYIRKDKMPFGGVQLLFIGDLLQLPPVVKEEEWQYLKTIYHSLYFFDAKALEENKPIYIELEKVYRQEGDQNFINLLNKLRNNAISITEINYLNNYYKEDVSEALMNGYITLTTHNHKAAKINSDRLKSIKETVYQYTAEVKGEFSEYSFPLDSMLELKKGAQVMFVKNDPTGAQRFFNGKIGTVSELSTEFIKVKFEDSNNIIQVSKYEWSNVKYEIDAVSNEIKEVPVGSFLQYPLRLAWAITVHKSQGLTFDKAIIDIGQAFAPGQVYVALSRLRSLKGLVLKTKFESQNLHQNEDINAFSKQKDAVNDLNLLMKNESEKFLFDYLKKSFDFGFLAHAVSGFVYGADKKDKKAIKQKYLHWSLGIKKEIDEIKPHADKFVLQLNSIINSGNRHYIDTLEDRVKAANNYFANFFGQLSNKVFNHLEVIKSEKKIKTYQHDVLDLEKIFNEQLKRINKALGLTLAFKHNTLFEKRDAVQMYSNKERIEMLNSISTSDFSQKTSKKKAIEKSDKRKEPTASKVEKIGTKAETLMLLNQGKKIAEIATLRGLSSSTIEGHIIQLVSKGEADALAIIEKTQIEKIIASSKSIGTFNLNPIKEELGESVSYFEIRLALAFYLSESSKV